jgi:hypothetical protein
MVGITTDIMVDITTVIIPTIRITITTTIIITITTITKTTTKEVVSHITTTTGAQVCPTLYTEEVAELHAIHHQYKTCEAMARFSQNRLHQITAGV